VRTPSARAAAAGGIRLAPRKGARLNQQAIVSAIFAALFIGLSLLVPGFLDLENLLALVHSVAILGMVGLAMALVVIGRGIDVSLIASLALPPGILLQMVNDGHSVGAALAVAVAVALIFGLANGWLVAFAEVPPLFATLATALFLAGFGQVFFFQVDIVQWNAKLGGLEWLGRGSVLGLPKPVVMFAVTALLASLLLRRTRIGAFIHALGDNPSAARVTGIPTRPLIVLKYLLSASIGAFAGIVLAASLGSMPTRIYNSTMVYDVILVVVLGGISLSGGRGGVSNVVIGTLLIGTILNGMTILDLSYPTQNFIKGVILLSAVILDSILNPRNEETAQQSDI
jgi:ribose transport system permease protein